MLDLWKLPDLWTHGARPQGPWKTREQVFHSSHRPLSWSCSKTKALTCPRHRGNLRALEALDAILQGVDGGTLTAPEAIEQLLAAQIQLRNNRRLQAAMRSSRLPAVKELRSFDFTSQPSLRREQIQSLHELGSTRVALGDRSGVARAIDRRTAVGRRDYAMFLLITTYGLRACEVVGLTLDDLDWRRRRLPVRSERPARSCGCP
jgi:hypothetical protein